MGFILFPRLTLNIYIYVENTGVPSLAFFNISNILLFSPRALNKSPAEILWKHRNIQTEMPVFLALPNSAAFPSRAAKNTGAESFYLTFDSVGRKGDECTFARATKRKRKGGEETRERKGKNVNEPVSVAPARTYTAECSLTAWRRDARRRQ